MSHSLTQAIRQLFSRPTRRRNVASKCLADSCEQLECRQLLTVYSIDPVNGSDSNPGTIDLPFKTPRNLSEIFSNDNSNFHHLEAGDTVYLRDGVHDWTELMQHVTGNDGAFYIDNVHGTAESPVTIQTFPGEHPIVQGHTSAEAKAIRIENSDNVKVLGLEIQDTYGVAIWASESRDIEIANNYVHDVDGSRLNNIAGIYSLSNIGIHIHDNLLHDNYDHMAADNGTQTANSRNIVIFGEGSDHIEVDHNTIFNTPNGQVKGAGIFIKHADTIPGASYLIHDNFIKDVDFTAIGSQASNVTMRNNLIIDSAPFHSSTGDNVTKFHDLVFENNTYVGEPVVVFELNPADNLTYPDSGFMTFQQNIVVDDASSYSTENAIIRIANYGKDSDYPKIVTPQNLLFDNNVYFNPQTAPAFDVFGTNGDQYGDLGALLDFAGWQALGIEQNSQVIDPQLDASFIPLNPLASNAGWLSGDQPRLAMYIATDLISETSGDNASSITLIRCGTDTSGPLTVNLTVSDTTEIDVPAQVTFAAGESVIHVPINALNDHVVEPTRGVQINASAGESLRTSGWVRVTQETETQPTPPSLELGGSGVTWANKQSPVSVLPQITVGDGSDLSGGTLTISASVVVTKNKLLDQFKLSSLGSLGSQQAPIVLNGTVTVAVQLNNNVSGASIQSALRGITFSTSGKGLNQATRTVHVTLADADGLHDSVIQTIHVQKKRIRSSSHQDH